MGWSVPGLSQLSNPISARSVNYKTVFDDPLYIDFYDPDHSEQEAHYLMVGESNQRRLLIVSYTERDELTRLISAREVTRSEREAYEKG